MRDEDCAPEYCLKPTLILGCGNILLGDDGFGPRVVESLRQRYTIPEDVAVLDAGTGVGEILLDVALSPLKPQRIALVDVLDCGQHAGAISVLPLAGLPQKVNRFFPLHQEPTASLLKELEAVGAEVVLVTVQPESIPDSVNVGLSSPVQKAVSRACEYIVQSFFEPYGGMT